MNLRRACEHGRYEEHWEEIGAICSGGTEPTTEELIRALIEKETPYTIRCAACELAGCHVGVNGGHAGGTDNPPVHTRDTWLLTDLNVNEHEAIEEQVTP